MLCQWALAFSRSENSYNRAMYDNARLDTIEKVATALGVSIKRLFDLIDDDTVEAYIKIKEKSISLIVEKNWKIC